jgi:hypothetical protein
MGGKGCFGKIGDLGSIADIGAVNAHFSSACLCDLGGDARKACFVAIGERKVCAARGEFDRKRAAYAAGRTSDSGSGSLDRGHWLLRLERWIVSFVRLCRARCKGPRARRHSLSRRLRRVRWLVRSSDRRIVCAIGPLRWQKCAKMHNICG